jgi:hypothetical protein
MKKQFLLASASILAAMIAAGAYAEDLNQTNINQTGSNGQATITQSGSGNVAGTATTSISQSLVQAGASETLNVTQSGVNNTFQGATPNNPAPGSLVQSGAGNVANVTQSGTASTVQLSQSGNNNGVFDNQHSEAFSPTGGINVLTQSANNSTVTLTQNGNNNTFGISQGGATNTIAITQRDVANEVHASQNDGVASDIITITRAAAPRSPTAATPMSRRPRAAVRRPR